MKLLATCRHFWFKRTCHTLSTCKLIQNTTEQTRDHLTPEIVLRLITPNCKLWYSKGDDLPYPDPYWAFYWPGGQALTRYILDNKHIFGDKNIIDVGSGCGASAIACKLAGARKVVANDIDKVALEAIKLNAAANEVDVCVSFDNLIGSFHSDWNILLLGDMFYDSHFVNIISEWIPQLAQNGVSVYLGDPGRISLMEHPLVLKLNLLCKYKLPENCLRENNGMNTCCVWEFCDR